MPRADGKETLSSKQKRVEDVESGHLLFVRKAWHILFVLKALERQSSLLALTLIEKTKLAY